MYFIISRNPEDSQCENPGPSAVKPYIYISVPRTRLVRDASARTYLYKKIKMSELNHQGMPESRETLGEWRESNNRDSARLRAVRETKDRRTHAIPKRVNGLGRAVRKR